MVVSTCQSCRLALQARFHRRLADLRISRRRLHSSNNLRSLYWETTPPTTVNLAAADTFFKTHPPRKLWTATEWRKDSTSTLEAHSLIPEIVFLGRSNAGKSSLLNAILLSPNLNYVGARPGKTTTMHAWALAPSDPVTGGAVKGFKGDTAPKLAVLDMPGYGHGSHGDWGGEIVKYLQRRKQLRRAFVLINAVHGITKNDRKMLEMLRAKSIPHQIVASKCDFFFAGDPRLQKALEGMRKATEADSGNGKIMMLGEIIAVGNLGDNRTNKHVVRRNMIGVDELQWAVLRAAGLDDYAMQRTQSKTGAIPTSYKTEIRPIASASTINEKLLDNKSPPDMKSFIELMESNISTTRNYAKLVESNLSTTVPPRQAVRSDRPTKQHARAQAVDDELSSGGMAELLQTSQRRRQASNSPRHTHQQTQAQAVDDWSNSGGMADLLGTSQRGSRPPVNRYGNPRKSTQEAKDEPWQPNVGGMAELLATSSSSSRSGRSKPRQESAGKSESAKSGRVGRRKEGRKKAARESAWNAL